MHLHGQAPRSHVAAASRQLVVHKEQVVRQAGAALAEAQVKGAQGPKKGLPAQENLGGQTA